MKRAAEGLEARKGLTVFLGPGVGEERARELAGVLDGFGEISSVTVCVPKVSVTTWLRPTIHTSA